MKKVRGAGFIKGFDWGLYPEAENFLHAEVKLFLRKHKFAGQLARKMTAESSTQIVDWIDHIKIPHARAKRLSDLGFKQLKIAAPPGTSVYKHTKTIFFPVLVHDSEVIELVLKPEYLDHCIKKLGVKTKIEGKQYSPLRYAQLKQEGKYLLSAVERRGSNGFIVTRSTDNTSYKKAFNLFARRRRLFRTDTEGLRKTIQLVNQTLKTLSRARTADAFFRNERRFWESRNRAGRIQRKRQDTLGLGWGNHDHHTYRSSRENFTKLIEIFEDMGYICRERFYAGAKAGWGAQVLEHPECDIVLFADVDVTRSEKDKDFAHKGLRHVQKLGTVGLWIGLHGESILQAGMHHLEARFDFNRLRKDLPSHKIEVMNPFSNFQFLKQAFTVGELWKVKKIRLDKLLREESITQGQHDTFLKRGAIGSHLENLQRKQGYKGFNQDSVSAILKVTDPRKQQHRGA